MSGKGDAGATTGPVCTTHVASGAGGVRTIPSSSEGPLLGSGTTTCPENETDLAETLGSVQTGRGVGI